MDALIVHEVRPDDARLAPLIDAHLSHSSVHSPDTSCHTMTAAELIAEPGLRMWLAELGDVPVACGALKPLAVDAEVKSVHVAETARGRGAARAIMEAIAGAARASGVTALYLETGSGTSCKATMRRGGYIMRWGSGPARRSKAMWRIPPAST
ncbi:MAG: GNAT family N-acetyltransferase [Pseudomonadota bacterium]